MNVKRIHVRVIMSVVLVMGASSTLLPVCYGFGKNKVTYKKFNWVVHESDHFEFYYYPEEKNLLPDVVRFFEEAYARISSELGTDLSDKTPVILYKTHREFEQTNILPGFIPQGVGGFSEPIKRRIVIPLEGSRHDLELLINHELVHTFQFEIFFQNRLTRIAPMPQWIMEGLAEHLSADWDPIGRMVIRDAVINNYLPSLRRMENFSSLTSMYLGYKAAQSALDFLRKKYGREKLRMLLWKMRKTLKTENYFEKAIEEVFDVSLDTLSDEWTEDLRRRVIEVERKREGVSAYEEIIRGQKKFHRRVSPVFSPGGELVFFVEAGEDGLQILSGTFDTEKEKEIVSCLTCRLNRFKYRQIIMDGRPLSGIYGSDRLVCLVRREDEIYLIELDAALKGVVRTYRIPQDAASSPALSPDGEKVAYAAFENGQSDIFVMDLDTGDVRKITDDEFVDETPCWSVDGLRIVYSTERDGQYDLYQVQVSNGKTSPLVISPGDETTPWFSPDGRKLTYISDRIDGVNDPYILDIDTKKIRRIAAPVTGMFTPVFSPDGSSLAVSFYYNNSQKIVILPENRSPRLPSTAETSLPLGIEGEADAFAFPKTEPAGPIPQSPSQLKDDPVRFKLIPDYAEGIISYGTDSDFYIEGGLLLSDILGNHRFTITALRRGNQNGYYLGYRYLRSRMDYGVNLFQDSEYYYVIDPYTGHLYEVDWDYYGGNLHAEYPFNTFYRVEMNFGYFKKNYDSFMDTYDVYDEEYAYVEPVFSGDTVIFRPLTGYPEPYRGHRFRISVRIPVTFSSDFEDYTNTYFDYRAYIPITRRGLVAIREWGILSSGSEPEVFGVGGYNTIRGYAYHTLVGNDVALTNIELRFPLIDEIRFPGSVSFYGFRGKLFVDIGAVWWKGKDKEWDFDDPDTLEEEGVLHAAAGFGVNFWFLGVEWHFEWARPTDFSSFGGEWVYQWSIRRSF